MNDRAAGIFENYDVKILGTAKGRGALLAETEQGWLILKEYTGPEARLELQEKLLQAVRDAGFPGVEQLLRNKEGELLTRDQDRTAYIVKTWFDGRECNLRDVKECQNAVRTLGRLHRAMEQPQLATQYAGRPFSLEKEYARHNRELKKVRRYLREKGQKSDFERFLLHHYDRFYEKALETEEQLRAETGEREAAVCAALAGGPEAQVASAAWNTPEAQSASAAKGVPAAHRRAADTGGCFCHGDLQHHNLLCCREGFSVINFEKYLVDNPVRDLYLFLRKLLEKNGWSSSIALSILTAYETQRTLSDQDRRQLYYRFAYPEKFWKIVNFYYNSGKAWIPGRNREKLENLLRQEEEKKAEEVEGNR